MSQADLSRATVMSGEYLSTAQISRVVSGNQNVGPGGLKAIAAAFGIPPEQVFRVAGVLPSEPEQTQKMKALDRLFADLSPAEQDDVLEYVRLRLRLSKGKSHAEKVARPPR